MIEGWATRTGRCPHLSLCQKYDRPFQTRVTSGRPAGHPAYSPKRRVTIRLSKLCLAGSALLSNDEYLCQLTSDI